MIDMHWVIKNVFRVCRSLPVGAVDLYLVPAVRPLRRAKQIDPSKRSWPLSLLKVDKRMQVKYSAVDIRAGQSANAHPGKEPAH